MKRIKHLPLWFYLFAIISSQRVFMDESEEENRQLDPTRLGDEGKHYSLDNGRAYILCESYNEKQCLDEGKTEKDCVKLERCYYDDVGDADSHNLGCMTTAVINTTIFDIPDENASHWRMPVPSDFSRLRGCWVHRVEARHVCMDREECFGPVSDKMPIKHMFCCCRTHGCNTMNLTSMTDNWYYYRERAIDHFKESDLDYTEEDVIKMAIQFMKDDGVWTQKMQDKFFPPHIDTSIFPRTYDAAVVWTVNAMSILLFLLFLIISAAIIAFLANKFYFRRNFNFLGVSFHAATIADIRGQYRSRRLRALRIQNLEEVELIEKISAGKFADVFRAKMKLFDSKRSRLVAIKRFHSHENEHFCQEADVLSLPTWAYMQHPNLIHFLGTYQYFDERGIEMFCIVTKFYQLGNLLEFCRNNTFTLDQATRVLNTMLDGLSFLHEESRTGHVVKPAIVHRDLKSRNIMLRHDLSSVIVDFGLAMRCDNIISRGQEVRGIMARPRRITQAGTARYMAPEVLEGATEFSVSAFRQTDVYSISLVMWEVLSQTRLSDDDRTSEYLMPYEEFVGKNPTLATMRDHVAYRKRRPKFRKSMYTNRKTSKMISTIQEMWDGDAEARITAGCALDRFREVSAYTRANIEVEESAEKVAPVEPEPPEEPTQQPAPIDNTTHMIALPVDNEASDVVEDDTSLFFHEHDDFASPKIMSQRTPSPVHDSPNRSLRTHFESHSLHEDVEMQPLSTQPAADG